MSGSATPQTALPPVSQMVRPFRYKEITITRLRDMMGTDLKRHKPDRYGKRRRRSWDSAPPPSGRPENFLSEFTTPCIVITDEVWPTL